MINYNIVEIYYGMPADFGAFGKGLTQHMIERYYGHLEWNIEKLKDEGAQDIRWCYQNESLGFERWA